MTEKELMLSQQLYIANDPKLAADNKKARKLTRQINTATEDQAEYRLQLFRELFAGIGKNFWIEPPFRTDYGSIMLSSQQTLIKLIQSNIDLHHVVILLLNEIADNQIELTAVGQGISRPANEIFGLLQI